jgi:hypothetical protein
LRFCHGDECSHRLETVHRTIAPDGIVPCQSSLFCSPWK